MYVPVSIPAHCASCISFHSNHQTQEGDSLSQNIHVIIAATREMTMCVCTYMSVTLGNVKYTNILPPLVTEFVR